MTQAARESADDEQGVCVIVPELAPSLNPEAARVLLRLLVNVARERGASVVGKDGGGREAA